MKKPSKQSYTLPELITTEFAVENGIAASEPPEGNSIRDIGQETLNDSFWS